MNTHVQPRDSSRAGFTLMELLTVIGIMTLLMGISLMGWFGIRRGAEMRGAVGAVRTTMLQARQYAISKRTTVVVTINSGMSGDYLATQTLSGAAVHSRIALPMGVKFTNSVTSVRFNPVGTADGAGPQVVSLVEVSKQRAAAADVRTITVWPLTGATKVGP